MHPLLSDPEAAARVEAMRIGTAPPSTGGDPVALRARLSWPRLPDDDAVTSAEAELPGAAGPMAARVYDPVRSAGRADAPAPVVLFLHGGGWVVGDLDTNDGLCRALAAASGIRLVSIDYRLAPEHPFPAALDDATAALAALAGGALGADPERLAVCGHSAGGNLAAALAIRSRDGAAPRIRHQALLSPVLDDVSERDSYRACLAGLPLTAADMAWYWSQYLADPAGRRDPLASPLRIADAAGLAPATIVAGTADPLCDEAVEYAHRLAEAEVPTVLQVVPGVPHLFLTWPIRSREAAVAAVGAQLAADLD